MEAVIDLTTDDDEEIEKDSSDCLSTEISTTFASVGTSKSRDQQGGMAYQI